MTDKKLNSTTADDRVIPFEQSLHIIDHELASYRLATESLPVGHARGRTLATEARSQLDLPPFDKSAMDGYATMANDIRDEYRVIESIPAGKTPCCRLEPGTAARVMTGAPVPPGAGRVIMYEKTDNGNENVKVSQHNSRTNICLQGEDIRAGDVVLTAGTRLGAVEIANLIACGLEKIAVYARARLAVLTTGDEIVSDPAQLTPGRIMNANEPLLAGLAAENDLEVVSTNTVADNHSASVEAIGTAADHADIVMITGGVSAGDRDCVGPALRELGYNIHFDRVAIQPGKPTTFATRSRSIVFGLPGNPVSVFNTFHTCVLRAITLLTGGTPRRPWLSVPLKTPYKRTRASRTMFIPCRIDEFGQAEVVEYNGSAHLLALSQADGLIQIPRGVNSLQAGAQARFFPSGRIS